MFKFINQRSLIAPRYFERGWENIRMGDKYQKVYLITKFPDKFAFGILHAAFNRPYIKLFYVTRPVKESMSKPLTRERNKLVDKLKKEKDDYVRGKINKEINDLDKSILDLVYSKDRSVDILMGFIVSAKSKQDLKDTCEMVINELEIGYHFGIDEINGLQEEILKSIIPLWVKSGLIKDLDYRYRIPLSSFSSAVLWPFRYDEMVDKEGFLLGYSSSSNGLIVHNPFLWLDDEQEAVSKQITAGSMVIMGKVGTGKTQTITKYARYFLRRGIRFIWIDPHNQNAKWFRKYGGKYVLFGTGESKINPLDLRLQDYVENEGIDPYDTELAKKDAISTFKTVVKLYHKTNIIEVEKALSIIDEIIMHTYQRKGITAKSFISYSNKDYPIISDVLDDIKEAIRLREEKKLPDDNLLKQLINLELFITPLCQADGIYFNGHTTADFESDNDMLLGFGTKKLDSKDKNIKEPVYHLIMRLFESHLYNTKRYCAGIWDEFQKVALNGYLLPKCSEAVRAVRKYRSILILGMQEPGDLASNIMVDGAVASSYGEAIINNSTYKLLLMLEPKAVEKAAAMINLSEEEAELLGDLRRGQGVFIRNNLEHYLINVYASPAEINEMKFD